MRPGGCISNNKLVGCKGDGAKFEALTPTIEAGSQEEWIDANKSVPIGVMARVKRWGGLRVVAGKDGDPQLPRHDYVPSCGTYLDVSAADISANFEAGMQLCWSAI